MLEKHFIYIIIILIIKGGNSVEIRVLRYFLAVAREGSITGAANLLHVTQPTLSRQIKELETKLDKQLFVRKSHSMELTDEGILLKRRAVEIIDMVGKVEDEFRSMEEMVAGDVYIGCGETEAMRLIANIVKDIQERYPHITFHLYSGNSEYVTEQLDNGYLDFGILIQPADISKYNFINLPHKETWGVLMRKESPLAEKESIVTSDLKDIPLILSRQAIESTVSQNEFSDWFGEDFEKINVVSTYNLIYNAAIMAEEGVGYVITLDKLVSTSEDSALCFRPLEPRLESEMNIVWKKHQIFSNAANVFFEAIQENFGGH